MRQAETVTFGGGGLDRAAHLRGQTSAIAALMNTSDTRMLPLWRGRPLLSDAGLGFLPPGHPALSGAGAQPADGPILIGIGNKGAIFATDLSDWTPDPSQDLPGSSFLDSTEQRHPDIDPSLRFAELRSRMAHLTAEEAEVAATAKGLLAWHESHRFCANCGQPTQMAMSGWQRLCGACGRSHFPRTDPVVIMLVTHGNSVLLGRSPGWPEGMYSLLAGFMEPGETIEAAVRREVAEEAGVTVGPVTYLASQPWPFPASLMIGCAGAALDTKITLDPAELADARWITREDMALILAGQHATIRAPRKGAIAGFLLAHWVADSLG
jgi:NAD+ diphosphatase